LLQEPDAFWMREIPGPAGNGTEATTQEGAASESAAAAVPSTVAV